jgi:maltose O-acetyltransferase
MNNTASLSPRSYMEHFLSQLPGRLGELLRYSYYKKRLGACGSTIRFAFNMRIISPSNLFLGENIELGWDTIFNATGGIHIGDFSGVAPGTVLLSESPVYTNPDIPIREQGLTSKKIIIGKDVWIGANCIINAGVTIGDGAIVAGGSVVSINIAPYALIAGNPGRTVGWRKSPKEILAPVIKT